MARSAAALLALALAASALGSGAPAMAKDGRGLEQADPWRGLDPNGHAQTCKHFANRTKFRERRPPPAHLAAAADACAEALALIAPDQARQALGAAAPMPPRLAAAGGFAPSKARAGQSRGEEAAALLDLLTRLRLTVRGMNAERLYGVADPRPRTLPVETTQGGWRYTGASRRPVSAAGEFLIAREMGVIAALRRWSQPR